MMSFIELSLQGIAGKRCNIHVCSTEHDSTWMHWKASKGFNEKNILLDLDIFYSKFRADRIFYLWYKILLLICADGAKLLWAKRLAPLLKPKSNNTDWFWFLYSLFSFYHSRLMNSRAQWHGKPAFFYFYGWCIIHKPIDIGMISKGINAHSYDST